MADTLNIEKTLSGDELTVTVAGRVNTMTAPELEAALNDEYSKVSKLVLDFKDLEYIS